jgi:hypothetical protein
MPVQASPDGLENVPPGSPRPSAAPARSPRGSRRRRKSDFPATAKYNRGQLPANVVDALKGIDVATSGAYLTVTIPAGGPTK